MGGREGGRKGRRTELWVERALHLNPQLVTYQNKTCSFHCQEQGDQWEWAENGSDAYSLFTLNLSDFVRCWREESMLAEKILHVNVLLPYFTLQ
jgi:hypothetical protein